MTTAEDCATLWNASVTKYGNTITLYDPTLSYNNEGDISTYTLGTGTSATAIVLEDTDGITYSSEVEGIADTLTLSVRFKTTESVDEETIIKWGSDYYTIFPGSFRKVTADDTVIAQKATMSKMLPQEAEKIA